MSIEHIVAAGLLSVLAGLMGSLLGLGGGLFVTPLLSGPIGMPIHRAVAASIVAVIATSSAGGSGYLKRGVPNVRLGMVLETGTVVGAIAGTLLGNALSVRAIAALFALVLIYTAISMLRGSKQRAVTLDPLAARLGLVGDYPIAHLRLGLLIAVLAGVVSGLLGVGGGIILVPAMVTLMGVPLKIAAATSTFMIGITGVASAVIQIQQGNVDPVLTAPVIFGIFAGATLGPRVAPHLTPTVLRVCFLLAIGLSIVEMARESLAMSIPPTTDHELLKRPAPANPGPILGRVLGYGSRASVLVIATGFILALAQNEHGGVGLRPGALGAALEHGHGTGILGLGMAVLIATPIAREAFALRFFARHGERPFVILSAIVLALVVCSSLIGGH